MLFRAARAPSYRLIPTRVQGETGGRIEAAIKFATDIIKLGRKNDVLLLGAAAVRQKIWGVYGRKVQTIRVRRSDSPPSARNRFKIAISLRPARADAERAAEIVAERKTNRHFAEKDGGCSLIDYNCFFSVRGDLQNDSPLGSFTEFPQRVKDGLQMQGNRTSAMKF